MPRCRCAPRRSRACTKTILSWRQSSTASPPSAIEPGEPTMIDVDELTGLARPKGMPFRIGKLGHVVINVRDVARSVRFYTEVLGFEVSDIYPDEMVPGG